MHYLDMICSVCLCFVKLQTKLGCVEVLLSLFNLEFGRWWPFYSQSRVPKETTKNVITIRKSHNIFPSWFITHSFFYSSKTRFDQEERWIAVHKVFDINIYELLISFIFSKIKLGIFGCLLFSSRHIYTWLLVCALCVCVRTWKIDLKKSSPFPFSFLRIPYNDII